MNALDIASFAIAPSGTAKFEGLGYDSPVSFFVVRSIPGTGAAKHRHPYVETFVILDGDIEIILDGELSMVGPGHIVVVPAMAWHEFKVRSEHPALMVNIHPGPEIIQEDWTG
jgi:mannose-6-phosphate isomerase-like protein (cupin superfamily)